MNALGSDKQIEKNMRDFISEICETIGPRKSCSENEAQLALFFREKIKEYCDEVEIDNFIVHPGAYKAAFRIPMILYLLSLIFYWYYALFSLILTLLSVLILFGEMSLAKEIIDFMFLKKQSQNVIGKIRPENHPSEFIIIGSHLDSSCEFPLMRMFKYGFIVIIAINLFLTGILLIILLIKNILIVIKLEALFLNIEIIFFWAFLILIPTVIIQLFFIISNHPVIGANDNLSGMAVCYEIVKNLSLPENKLKNVEVWICAFGCEEIGSKGSRNFVKKYIQDLKNAKVINLDMLGNRNAPLLVTTSEIFGFVKTDKEMNELILNFAEKLKIKIKPKSNMAFTDSLSFCRNQLSATSIITLPLSSKEFYYHTKDDVIENMSFENLINTLNLCNHIIKNLDNKPLKC